MIEQEVKVVEIRTVEQVLDYWKFFFEGLEELNLLLKPVDAISAKVLLQTLLHSIDLHQSQSLLVVITSKNDKPLLWGLIFDNTVLFKPKSCVVYAVYSNNKAKGLIQYGLRIAEKWARENHYKTMQAFCPKMNGSRFRLFEKVWGFQRHSMVFQKDL